MSESGSWRRLIELIALIALAETITKLVPAGLSLFGIVLPEMPLLHYAYLLFAFVVAAAVYFRLRGEGPEAFGLVAPKRIWVLIGRGVIAFLVIMCFDIVGRPLLDPIIQHLSGANPAQGVRHFASVKGNLALLLYLIPVAWLFAALGEEMLYRGFIMTRIAQLLGGSRGAWIAALFIQAIPFALGHAYQGAVGMVSVYVVALCYGAARLVWGRNLWPAIIAHGLQDTFGFVMLYLGLVKM